MLAELRVDNIALIEQAQLSFTGGLQVITGQTGAGKSLLIDALQLVLGSRADAELLRAGAEQGGAQAYFTLQDAPAAAQWLEENGFDPADGAILSRQLHQNGRNICRINGVMVTRTQLRQLAELLVDIHGQHEHQSLLQERQHQQLLDNYLQDTLAQPLEQMRQLMEQYRAVTRRLEEGFGSPEHRQRQIEVFEYQLAEINAAALQPGEEEELTARRTLLQHAQTIRTAMFGAYQLLYDGLGERRPSSLEQLAEAGNLLQPIAGLSEEYAALHNQVQELYFTLEDICMQLRQAKNQLQDDPGELEQVENRLQTIHTLEKKYGPQIQDVLAFAADIEEQLSGMRNAAQRIQQLQQQQQQLGQQMLEVAGQLHALRQRGAKRLAAAIGEQLAELGFSSAQFAIEVDMPQQPQEALAAMTNRGCDRVAFYMAANAGEGLKPLARVASGGEVARIMLALKTVLSQADAIPTLVFDEIDTGVSGRMAAVVANKLCRLGRGHQVFCVTHLPQMAAMADTHWLVEKREQEGRTRTHIVTLDTQGRVAQLAEMSSGSSTGQAALDHARELLADAERQKAQFS